MTEQPRTATYQVAINWANDGTFAGIYDDVTADVLGASGVTVDRGRDQERASGDVMVPAAGWTLNNASGTYSPQRGPLSSQLIPGRPVFVQMAAGDQVITMDDATVQMEASDVAMDGPLAARLITGTLDDLATTPEIGNRTVQIRALGSLLQLRGRSVSTPVYANVTTGNAMEYLLQAAGLAATDYVIDQDAKDSGRTISWWWVNDQDAYDAAVQLLDTEGPPAALYESGDGKVIFESRLYRSSAARSITSQATFRDTVEPGGLYYEQITYEPGLRDIINDVQFDVDVRTAGALGTVWTYGATLTLDGTGSASVLAQPTDPFVDAVTPASGSSDFTLSAGSVTVALSRTSGGSTLISFSGGTATATVSGLRLRAKPLSVTGTVAIRSGSTQATTDSQTKYGIRSYTPSLVRTLSLTDAQLLADSVVSNYADTRPIIRVSFVNADYDHLVQIITREVSDRVHIVNDYLGIDDDYTIEQLSHAIGTGALHQLTISCERAPLAIGVGRWLGSDTGTSVWSNDSGTTPNKGIWG